MKCKKCGEEINLTVFGAPPNICWDCLNKEEKEEEVLDVNINTDEILQPKDYIGKTLKRNHEFLKNIKK